MAELESRAVEIALAGVRCGQEHDGGKTLARVSGVLYACECGATYHRTEVLRCAAEGGRAGWLNLVPPPRFCVA
jgi:hypothetical protein